MDKEKEEKIVIYCKNCRYWNLSTKICDFGFLIMDQITGEYYLERPIKKVINDIKRDHYILNWDNNCKYFEKT